MERLRVLLVDDDIEMLTRVARNLGEQLGSGVDVISEGDFDKALSRLTTERFDAVVLDVRKGDPSVPLGDRGDEAGRQCFNAIRLRRFIPVVFHTALPDAVRDLQSPVVAIVAKGGAPAVLAKEVEKMVKGGLPALVRGVLDHVERVNRDYMWNFGAQAWSEYGSHKPEELVHLLARRIAVSLEEAGIGDLLAQVTRVERAEPAKGLNPVRLYIMPPLDLNSHRTGDIYKGQGDLAGFWVLITPTCDLVAKGGRSRKVDNPVLAHCTRLVDVDEYREWRDGQGSKSKKNLLTQLIDNNRNKQPERYFFLPGAFDLPDLVVDLAAIRTVSIEQLCEKADMQHIASLDNPFAASLLTRFLRYFGRFGTDDLDVDYVMHRISEAT